MPPKTLNALIKVLDWFRSGSILDHEPGLKPAVKTLQEWFDQHWFRLSSLVEHEPELKPAPDALKQWAGPRLNGSTKSGTRRSSLKPQNSNPPELARERNRERTIVDALTAILAVADPELRGQLLKACGAWADSGVNEPSENSCLKQCLLAVVTTAGDPNVPNCFYENN